EGSDILRQSCISGAVCGESGRAHQAANFVVCRGQRFDAADHDSTGGVILMKLQAEITGFEAVQKKLEKAGAQAGYMALARKGADEGGEIMLRALQDNVPYDT